MVTQLEMAARDRGLSTAVFEDPDQSVYADAELIAALEKKVKEDPTFIIPEGYKKEVQRIPRYHFRVAQPARDVLKESSVIGIEILDDIFHKAFGIHVLEPQFAFDTKVKVKPTFIKPKKKDQEPSYMKSKSPALVPQKTVDPTDKLKQSIFFTPKNVQE